MKNRTCQGSWAVLTVLILYTITVSGKKCASGWTSRAGDSTCYYISPQSKTTTWAKAQQFCRNAKGDLLKIDTADLKTFIYAAINKRLAANKRRTHWWVGLHRDDSKSPWKWGDGSAINNQLGLWRPGEPNNDPGFFGGLFGLKENCADLHYDTAKGLGFNDVTCSASHPFICSSTSNIPSVCGTGWTLVNRVCYKYISTGRSFQDAEANCELGGGQLANPLNLVTEQTIQNYAKQNKKDVWIYVYSQPTTGTPKYQIVSGSAATLVTTAFWAPHQPQVPSGQENATCVKILSNANGNTGWSTASCDAENRFVCQKVPGGCAPGWTPFSNKCYQFNAQTTKSWADASTYCQQQGAILMEITTKDQQQNFLVPFMADLQEENVDSIWIGMSDGESGQLQTLKWSSNTPMKYTNWATTFPNNTKGKMDCGLIYTDDDAGKWVNTVNCLQPKAFLCQAGANDVISPITTPIPTVSCDNGWLLSKGKCYKFVDQPQTWLGAQTGCTQQLGGSLVRILNKVTQSFINKHIKQETWTGLNDRAQNGQYRWNSDSFAPSYTNWAAGQPDQHQEQNCGTIMGKGSSLGKWRDTDCQLTYGYICEKIPNNVPPSPGPSTTTVAWSKNCGPFWDENPLTGFCYKFTDQVLSWRDARDYCQNSDNNGDLASITSLDEQNYVSGRLTGQSYLAYWLGGSDLNQEGGWEWMDDSGFAFMNWGRGQPDDYKKRQDCLRFVLKTQTWDDVQCSVRYPFVCKKPGKNARPVPTESTVVEPACGRGWRRNNEKCYQFNQKRTNWNTARQDCRRKGGDLISILDEATQTYINDYVQVNSWCSLNDRFIKNTFIWADGNQTLPYTNWANGEPNNKATFDCGTVLADPSQLGKWQDNKCSSKYGYICQKPASCGRNWYLYGTYCYYFNTTGVSWEAARQNCVKQGGDLLTIPTKDIQSYILGKVLIDSWIGLNDRLKNKQYMWLDDPTKVTYFNWAPKQPGNKDSEDCGLVMKTTGQWSDRSCTDSHGFVCQKLASRLVLGCPKGWVDYEDHCYWFSTDPKLSSWQTALKRCHARYADLASIKNPEEQRFLFSQATKLKTPVWIGLNDLDNFAGHRMFSWTDNNPVTFTNWAKGEPNNYGKNTENCVALNHDRHGGWDDYQCATHAVQSFVCEREMRPTVMTTADPLNVGCTTGIGYFGMCYTFQTNRLGFNNAEKYCKSKLKGHLASINSRYIQAFIASELANKRGNWWIGLSNKDPLVYTWTNGQKLAYTNFDVSHTGKEPAGAVSMSASKPKGLWNNQAKLTTLMPFICERKRIGAFTNPPPDLPTPNPFASCPNRWVEHNGYCYSASYSSGPRRKFWLEARAICQQWGGDLVSIHSQAEEDFVVKTVIGRYPGIYWIGLNDMQKEKGFKWSDSTPFDYNNWAPSQPDDHKQHEDCVEYNKATDKWNDDNCNIAKNYICKAIRGAVPPGNNVVVPTMGPNIPCTGRLGRFSYFNGNCYYVSYTRKTFFKSRSWCAYAGGDLVSIHNHAESDFIIAMLSKQTTNDFWIGLNELGAHGYNWTDASAVNFLNWYQGEPDDMFGGESCVHMIRDGFWRDTNCGILKRYVCKAANGTNALLTTPRPTIAQGNCPVGFSGIDGKCYIIKGDQASDVVNWTTAVSRCSQMGPGITIATVSSSSQQALITSMLFNKKYYVWIGLNDVQTTNTFNWVDNSPVRYTRWAQGEPNGYSASFFPQQQMPDLEDCVEIYSSNSHPGYWNDKRCSALRGYVCQATKSPSYPPPAITPLPTYCMQGYTAYSTSCYKFDTTKRSWNNAAMACQNDGAHLVSIGSAFEQAFLRVFMHGKEQTLWTGLSQTLATGLYNWIDQWPVLYTNWGRREPSRNGDTCVQFSRYGYWYDTTCDKLLPTICEISTGTPPPYTTRPPGYCSDPSWVLRGDYCYYINKNARLATQAKKSWPDAQYTCSKMGMNLATIRNPNDNTFIQGLLKTGAFSTRYMSWIGLQSKEGAGYTWEDGTPLAYANWGKNEPSNNRSRTDEDCVVISASTAMWYDISCFNKHLFVCMTPKIVPTPGSAIPTTTGNNTPLPVISQISTKGPQKSTKAPVKTAQPTRIHPPRKTNKPATKKPVTQRPRVTKKPTKAPTVKPITRGPHYRPFTPFAHQTNPPARTASPTRRPVNQPLNQNSPASTGISGGGIAGICIAIILATALATVFILYHRRRQSILRLQTSVGFDNALYNKTGDNLDIGGND